MTPLQEAAKKLKQAAIGALKRRDVDRLAKKPRRELSAFFRKQKRLTLEAMEKQKYLFSESFGKLSEGTVDFTKNSWQQTWEDIERGTEWELQQIITQAEATAMSKGATVAKTLFVPGKGGSFNLVNPRAVNWFLDKGGSVDYIRGINHTTGDQIKTLIGRAIDQGQSYTQTAKQIAEKFDGFSRSRAQMIAVHESGQAYEAGNRMLIDSVADQGIQMQKRWMDSGDDLVTPECAANSAEGWIPLKDLHLSGHQGPPRFPRCRCWEDYEEVPT